MKKNQNQNGGRPKLPTGKKRVHRVFVSYTDAEHEEVTLKASRNGLSLSTWLRFVSLSSEIAPRQ